MKEINLREIRVHSNSKNLAFEELCCQLASLEPPEAGAQWIRKEGAGGDAGVEAYWRLQNGNEHCWQVKFPNRDSPPWRQIDKSVKTALRKHPNMVHYVVCLPIDLTDSQRKKGESKINAWNKINPNVNFEFWGKHEITERLMCESNRGRILYWFDKELFTPKWFKDKFDIVVQDLGDRFNPEDHVEISISGALNGLAQSKRYISLVKEWFSKMPDIKDVVKKIYELENPPENLAISLKEKIIVLYNMKKNLLDDGFSIETWNAQIESIKANIGELEIWLKKYRYSDEDVNISEGRYPSRRSYGKSFIGNRNNDTWGSAERKLHEFKETFLSLCNKIKGLININKRKLLIIVGNAGVGKSHLFADTVKNLTEGGAPALLLLGGDFDGRNIRQGFLDRLDVSNRQFEEVLQALNVAGETSRTRCLILIDALNESSDIRIWQGQLAGFAQEIKKYKWLALGISVRNEYIERIIPENLKQDASIIEHQGIRKYSEWQKASKQYLEKRGISPHSLPWPPSEFFNFLFLKTCCDALCNSGETEFPRGLQGQKDIVGFYLKKLHSKLEKDCPEYNFPGAINKTVKAIARNMAERKEHFIKHNDAIEICNAIFLNPCPPGKGSWFNILKREGLFLDQPAPESVEDNSVYIFTFQRFSDHFIVEALLENIDDIQSAVSNKGELSYLFGGENSYKHYSLYEAMSVQVAEKYNKELIGLFSDHKNNIPAQALEEAFASSLLSRKKEAFTDETFNVVNALSTKRHEPPFGILIQLATVRDHPWNAVFLDQFLLSKSMAERDAMWTIWVNKASQAEYSIWESTTKTNSFDYEEEYNDDSLLSPIFHLINWCRDADLQHVEYETLRLAATCLSWFLTSSNRLIRDRSTKALGRVMHASPGLILHILKHFSSVNDLYVLERVYAAAYGAICNNVPEDILKETATWVYKEVFREGKPIPHILIRDYARGIVEKANHMGALPASTDINKARPPYNSDWPIGNPSDEEIENLVQSTGADAIESSVAAYKDYIHDFGTYTMHEIYSEKFKERTEEKKPFDSKWAYKWVIKKAVSFGWNKDLFGEFERNYTSYEERHGTSGRIERIGKKYQWLAYHELLARFADNLDFDDYNLDTGEALVAPIQATWQVHARDIDPTIIGLTPIENSENKFFVPSWVNDDKQFSQEENAAWLEEKADIPSIKNIIEKNSGWVYLFASNSCSSKHTLLANESYRDFWWRVSSVIVKNSDIEKLTEEFSNKDLKSPYILGGIRDETNSSFLQELTFHPDAQISARVSQHNFNYSDAIPPISSWGWESGQDATLQHGSLFTEIPNVLLRCVLNINRFQLNKDVLIGFNKNDEQVYQASHSYSMEPSDRATWACIRADLLKEYLRKNKLSLFWAMGGEKMILGKDRSHQNDRSNFSNWAYWPSDALNVGTPYFKKD